MSAPASEMVDTQHVNITTTASSDPEDGRAETRSQTGSLKERVRHALSRYDDMVLATDRVPFWNNMLASLLSWLLLAGFLVLPGTFSNLNKVSTSVNGVNQALHAIQNLPLFIVAYTLCAIGAAGLLWLWWHQRGNYIWLLRSIFVPGVFNGLSGLITTFVGIYATQKRIARPIWDSSSITTLIVISATTFICSLLATIYTLLKLRTHKVLAKPRDSEKGEEKEKEVEKEK